MGIFDKLMFWKQPDEILTPNNAGLDIQMPDLNNHNSGMPNMNNMDQQLGLNGMDSGLPPQEQSQNPMMPQAFGQQQSFQQSNSFQNSQPTQSFQQPASSDMQKDIQILSLKLDAIKSTLDSLNQRVANIERIAENEQVKQTQTQKRWY